VGRHQSAAPKPVEAAAAASSWTEDKPQAKERPATDLAGPAAQKKTESEAPAKAVVASGQASTAELNREVGVEAAQALTPQPVESLNWDGNWPQLAAALPVRGVVQQLAQQSELVNCDHDGGQIRFDLRVPLETLRSAGSVDKLAAALTEHFGQPVRVSTQIGAVRQTANAQALAERAARQREAEQTLQSDPFVQTLMREFGATIVPGSIKPV
jgi:DNA polymerase-3 subunit gamma/tau